MRKVVMMLAAGLLLLGSGAGSQGEGQKKKKEDPAKETTVAGLMKRKLENAQKVLEGIAVNDFEKIAKHGENLIAISKKTEWRVVQTPRYEAFSDDFQSAAGDLVKAGKDRNIDAAALAYMQMTMSCVRCHKYMREVRMARLD